MRLSRIRPAHPQDDPAIVDIWHDGWHDAHANIVPHGVLEFRTVEYFRLWLKRSPDQFHVALDGDVVGFVALNGSELIKLYVAAAARGTGTAQALLAYA